MKITSSAFSHNKPIPKKYSCEGEDLSPSFDIADVPEDAASLVMIMDDPDAPGGTFDHWIAWNISPQTAHVLEGQPMTYQGMTGFGRVGYGGPCPPPGPVHHYYFKLYALDCMLELSQGASKGQVEGAMEGHVLAQAELIGTYQR